MPPPRARTGAAVARRDGSRDHGDRLGLFLQLGWDWPGSALHAQLGPRGVRPATQLLRAADHPPYCAATERIKLMTGAVVLPVRDPVVLAKDEGIEALRVLLDQRRASFHGRHNRFQEVELYPKPRQPRLPGHLRA